MWSTATADEHGRWIVRGSGLYSLVANDESIVMEGLPAPAGEETRTFGIDDGPGAVLSAEYLWTERLGIEAALMPTYHDTSMTLSNDQGTFTATDSMLMRTVTLGINYRFSTTGRAHYSLGGFVPLMYPERTDYEFAGLGRSEKLTFDQDYGLGVKAALDWPFSSDSPWMMSVVARYQTIILESEVSGGDVDVNPFSLSIGVGYRF
jgi:outer membrane protein W